MQAARNAAVATSWKATWDLTMTRPDGDAGESPAPTTDLEGSDDRALVTAFLSGRREAFDLIVQRHRRNIYLLCYRFAGNHEDASDMTQDVFVRAWQKIGLFRGESAFGTWLHRLAINVVLARRSDLGKARDRFLDDETALDRISSRPVTVDARVDFEAALARLPDGARQVFVLHDVEGS